MRRDFFVKEPNLRFINNTSGDSKIYIFMKVQTYKNNGQGIVCNLSCTFTNTLCKPICQGLRIPESIYESHKVPGSETPWCTKKKFSV